MDLINKKNNQANIVGTSGSPLSAGGFNPGKMKRSLISPAVIILVFSLLVISLIVYGGLFFYQLKIEKDINASRQAYEEIVNRQDENVLKKIVSQGENAEMLSGLLKSHRYLSNLFKALREATLSQVQWTAFSLSANSKDKISLSGNVASYKVLAQQMAVFKKDKNWSGASFSSIKLDKNGIITFLADVEFSPSLLINK
ncbi:MAG: hypothetical protein UU87_C0001G0075 [Parcubacteria group bacterium GW2011_GWA2_42_11]|nr:MAG: hypothetical protein UU87_C0001G0075 [Parcubacteria group bacterium GW2011_GWA2_42_11]